MARIGGLIFGLLLLVIVSSIASPASAWDSDDDDDHKPRYKHRHYHAPPPLVRQPILIPPQRVDRYDYQYSPPRYDYAPGQYPNDPVNPYRIDYGAPQYQPVPNYQPPAPDYHPNPDYQPVPEREYPSQIPLAPPPLPPEELFGADPSEPISGPKFATTEPELPITPECRAGEFVTFETALYPHVRVKGREEIPRHAVPQILAVQSPDPFRFPGLVYVQVFAPPGRPREMKVENGGTKVEMKYAELEIKIASAKGIVSVEYDD